MRVIPFTGHVLLRAKKLKIVVIQTLQGIAGFFVC